MIDMNKVKAALALCAAGCDGDGCIYLKELGECDGLECRRCVDLLAADALELINYLGERVNVVRCRDCIYGFSCGTDSVFCTRRRLTINLGDWYCADGRKKDG